MLTATARAELARNRQRRVGNIGHDDFRSAAIAGHDDHQRADRPASGHQHALAEQRARLLAGVKADRQRLSHRGFAERERIGDRHGLRRIDRDVFAKPALHVRHPHRAAHEAHVQALIAHPFAAMDTDAAGLARIHGHPNARLEMRHAAADCGDYAGYFMSKRHRLLDPHRAEAAMMVVVQVRAADAAGGDLDAHFVGRRCRIGIAVDPQVFRGVDDDGAHGCSPWFPVRLTSPPAYRRRHR